MYNQSNIRLHVDLFIKYVSNNVYSDNNHGQPQSILNIFLTFFSSLYFMTTFCGLFSVWYWYHWFFLLLGGMKMSGSAGLFNKPNFFFLLHREPKGGRSGRWETQKKYGHPYDMLYVLSQRNFMLKKKNVTEAFLRLPPPPLLKLTAPTTTTMDKSAFEKLRCHMAQRS